MPMLRLIQHTPADIHTCYGKVSLEKNVVSSCPTTHMKQSTYGLRRISIDQIDISRNLHFVICGICQNVFSPRKFVVCDPR